MKIITDRDEPGHQTARADQQEKDGRHLPSVYHGMHR
jgi:hypothetical protein